MSLVIDSTRQSTPACLKISTAKSYHEQRPRAGHVVDAVVLAVEQPHEARGEVPGVRRAADLVAHDHDLLAVLGEAEHRLDEVAAVDAEQPG